jgi:hypothetical protein
MDERLDERVDRWLDRGRRLVDGVSGTRPGARAGGRGAERRGDARPSAAGIGRWVEDRLDRLLEDDDDWREPWEEGEQARTAAPRRAAGRRPLEAVSRRVARPAPAQESPARPTAGAEAAAAAEDWPDDEAFTPSRWRRGEAARSTADPAPRPRGTAAPEPRRGRRPLPRSSRRR